jgi:hypothetical protein
MSEDRRTNMTDKQDWSPEPWKRGGTFTNKDGLTQYKLVDANGDPLTWSDALIDRMFACVNACAGIPTEDLLLFAMSDAHSIKGNTLMIYTSYEPPGANIPTNP